MTDPSLRVECEHAAECPGCPLIGRPYGEQLDVKARAVRAAIVRFPEVSGSVVSPAVGADPILGYRRRAKLAVAGRAVGLFAHGSHRVVDLPGCRVQDPLILRIFSLVRDLSPAVPTLSALDVARVPGGALVTLVVAEGEDRDRVLGLASRLAAAEPTVLGVAESRRPRGSPQLLGRAPQRISGVDRVKVEEAQGRPFYYAAHGAFTQAHAGQRRALEDAVMAAVAPHARVLELFAGSGALSLSLSALGKRVHAVEAFAPAAELARSAAREQKLEMDIEAADAETAARRLASSGATFDAVVVNPPRRGLPPGLRRAVCEVGAETVVYVSCEPRTLARDLADLSRRGYSPRALSPYDMMPLTEEVETLAILERSEVPAPEVLFADERLIAVSKPPHEPTIPQGEHQGSLLSRVRRMDGAGLAVPVHRLDAGTSGVCLFARRPEHAGELGRALSEGHKEYVALLRGVTRKKGIVNRPLPEGGRVREARTRYARIEVIGGHSQVAVYPEQGQKHQVRRHLASIGHGVVGDERYGDAATNAHFFMKHGLDRPFLHARAVSMEYEGKPLTLTAPLAPDLLLVLESLSASRARTRDP